MTSDQQLPDPPVPADCDLRQFPYMPLDITKLFNSDFHAITNAEEWRAGLTLWMKSFHQVPAASLPNDDVILCRLAELGRDLEAWKAIKERALHGWILCADGRLYHPVVAEKANEAWKSKQERTEKARDRANARWHPERTSERRRSRAHASAMPEQCDSNATALPQHGLVREPSELESSARDCAKQGADSVSVHKEKINESYGYATALPEHCQSNAAAMLTETDTETDIRTNQQCVGKGGLGEKPNRVAPLSRGSPSSSPESAPPLPDTDPKPRKVRPLSVSALCEALPGLSPPVAADYLAHRKAKNAPLTESAWTVICREIHESGVPPDDALSEAMAAGWASFKANWLANRNQHGGMHHGQDPTYPSASGGRSLSAVERVRIASAAWAEREEQRIREAGNVIDIT
ncbi:YdaU family protein [Acidithiobacillus sp. VAN18-1]|uniref:YdaU family protein n=1 Tax=Igneacidithiobacillus copahuensis TaxID=2724909 RepID=A0AAE3CK66_9PROT|nr:DUF1376 domain-containing protein [Igneacidithiobacillus copahuensis]MBU2788449.1 YdaU family protein [Igneacidithiobacillus copahuensis]MBU2796911.1 YdaU family protein [Acidithiobacillus sp. VAN18-2]